MTTIPGAAIEAAERALRAWTHSPENIARVAVGAAMPAIREAIAQEIENERLLAHVMTARTRWFKVGHALLNFGRRNVPEDRDSRNPIKWFAAEIGVWMDVIQTRRTNNKLDAARIVRGGTP